MLAGLAASGIEPQPGGGVGGDDELRPIRFFAGFAGLDAALVVVVDGEAIVSSGAPVLRAPELGEVLVYAARLAVPFRVGLRSRSPNDWLEVKAGGYPEYRERCRELLRARGITVEEFA
jgi:hypothetical protein